MANERAEWLERVALTDPLTGLANARTLARVLELEVARAQRQGTEVSVALFDVDAFRELNEAAGSRAGDQVLRQVASVLAASVRLVDTLGRTGGDEFVLVAPGSAGVTVAQADHGRHRRPRGRRRTHDQRAARASPGSRRTGRTPRRCSRRPGPPSRPAPVAPRSWRPGPRLCRPHRRRQAGGHAPGLSRSRSPRSAPAGAVAPGWGSRVSARTVAGARDRRGPDARRRSRRPPTSKSPSDTGVPSAPIAHAV